MVAYSFQKQFIAPIISGRKAQTIRAPRKRHAREGEALQLYTGMRTKQCRPIGGATCSSIENVHLNFAHDKVVVWAIDQDSSVGEMIVTRPALNAFAERDGFTSWADMRGFWADLPSFIGVLVCWRDFAPSAEAA